MMLLIVTGVGVPSTFIRSATCTMIRASRVLRQPEPVHVFDARHRAGEQFPSDVRLLGTGRRIQLSADRFLVSNAHRRRTRARRLSSPIASATSDSCSELSSVWATLGTLNFAELEKSFGEHRKSSATLATVGWPANFLRRGRQVRAVPAARLAAGRHGRSHPGQRADPCGDDGGCRRLHAVPRVFFIRDTAGLPDSDGFDLPGSAAFTALLAALIAVQQNDIKRILAYSTLSQLGYMVMAVGVAWSDPAAMFHLSTHAFFKALLFLGAGSVIHALHHEQDIWKMGGASEENARHLLDFLSARWRSAACLAVERFLQQGRNPRCRVAKGQLFLFSSARSWQC